MAKKRVFVDTNVILECFRINVWTELASRCQLETVEKCVEEALTGRQDKANFIVVDPVALKNGLYKVHAVTQRDVDRFILTYEEMYRLDDGELHLYAYLWVNNVRLSEVAVLSTADRGAIIRANDVLDWLDWIQSLEELLKEAKFPRSAVEAVRRPHTSKFLTDARTDVRNGILR